MSSFSFSIRDKALDDILKECPLISFLTPLVNLLYNINLSSPEGIILLEINAIVLLSIFIPPINGGFSFNCFFSRIWESKLLVIFQIPLFPVIIYLFSIVGIEKIVCKAKSSDWYFFLV